LPILYLSAYIIENKDDYYYLLNNVTTLGRWREWILYMLKAVEETSIYTIKRVTEIDNLFNRTCDLVRKKLPHISKETVEKIFEQPYISPKKLIGYDIKSLNTAKKYMGQMEAIGILTSQKIGKEIVYLNIDLFNLLSET
jgi:Fic family protein